MRSGRYLTDISNQIYMDRIREESFVRVQALRDYLLVHDSLEGFDMDKDDTKDYPQEDLSSEGWKR